MSEEIGYGPTEPENKGFSNEGVVFDLDGFVGADAFPPEGERGDPKEDVQDEDSMPDFVPPSLNFGAFSESTPSQKMPEIAFGEEASYDDHTERETEEDYKEVPEQEAEMTGILSDTPSMDWNEEDPFDLFAEDKPVKEPPSSPKKSRKNTKPKEGESPDPKKQKKDSGDASGGIWQKFKSAFGKKEPRKEEDPFETPGEDHPEGQGTLYLSPKKGSTHGGIKIPKDHAVIIGRTKEKAQIVVKGNDVSEEHAIVSFDHGDYYIVDNHSRNGTFINGAELEPGREAHIEPMMKIQFASRTYYAVFVDSD